MKAQRHSLLFVAIVASVVMLAISGCKEKETYTVTFDANGGKGTAATGRVRSVLALPKEHGLFSSILTFATLTTAVVFADNLSEQYWWNRWRGRF